MTEPLWKQNLQLEGRGSWRGAVFMVDSAESTIGRRTAVFKYPGRNTPYVEDLGRETRQFHLTCYVIGADYHVSRDVLRAEFEKPGTGQLVHPYWGQFTAQVISPIKISERASEGGLARFDLELVEVKDAKLTIADPDLVPIVKAKSASLLDKIGTAYKAIFSVAHAVKDTVDAAAQAVQDMVSRVRRVRGAINAAVGAVESTATAIDELGSQVSALILAPEAMVSSVQGVTASVLGAISDVSSALNELALVGGATFNTSASDGPLFGDFMAQRLLDAFEQLTTAGDETEPTIDTGSAQDDIRERNRKALVMLFEVSSAAQAVTTALDMQFGSRDITVQVRDAISVRIDELVNESIDDTTWASMVDMREAFYRYMTEVADVLPDLQAHTLVQNTPTLVLAYELYGDAKRDFEINARNAVENPAEVLGGTELLVVSYE